MILEIKLLINKKNNALQVCDNQKKTPIVKLHTEKKSISKSGEHLFFTSFFMDFLVYLD